MRSRCLRCTRGRHRGGRLRAPLIAGAAESVVHLDDLLLRRTGLPLTFADGGLASLREVQSGVQRVLGWDDERWTTEEDRYRELWNRYYSPPA